MSCELFDAINKACGELPEEMGLDIHCENGSATIGLFDYELQCVVSAPDPADLTLAEQVGDALAAAIKHHEWKGSQ